MYHFGHSIRIGKSAAACFGNKSCQFVQIGVCQIVHSLKVFHERNGGGAGILNVLVLSHAGAFQKQVVCKPLLLPCQILNDIKSGSGEGSESLVAIVVHIDLLGDPAKTEMVGNHKGVHEVILWQVRIGFLKLFDLLRI